jgi:hypothetical protein
MRGEEREGSGKGRERRGEGDQRETSEPRDDLDPSAGRLRRPPAVRGVDPSWDDGRSEEDVEMR